MICKFIYVFSVYLFFFFLYLPLLASLYNLYFKNYIYIFYKMKTHVNFVTYILIFFTNFKDVFLSKRMKPIKWGHSTLQMAHRSVLLIYIFVPMFKQSIVSFTLQIAHRSVLLIYIFIPMFKQSIVSFNMIIIWWCTYWWNFTLFIIFYYFLK